MSSLQLLNAINAKAVARLSEPSRGLLYVEAQVKGKTTKAMIDTGATHTLFQWKKQRDSG